MKVFCQACDRVEDLTPLEAEKVIYVLEAEQRFDPARDDGKPEVCRWDTPMCIHGALALADDSEGYAEHVESLLGWRRHYGSASAVSNGDADG